jgi:hypothetical protein
MDSSSGSDTITLRIWDGSPQNSSNISYQTKDFDFGTPSKRKKIYAFHVTYKSTATSIANALSYAVDGSTTYATDNLTNNTLDEASDFEIAEITLSTPIECQSLSVKISSIGTATQLEINDISIEYRPLYKKLEST